MHTPPFFHHAPTILPISGTAYPVKMAAAVELLNFNVGVVGHIDSGKTSLSKVLSTIASTASFDKNPQSQQRGITLDLGFSSFVVDFPERLRTPECANYKKLQFTLVDCPGHASLIRTIIGGSHIIDMMLLVVDATKGFQTQTAECLVLGEITTPKMVVALNKIDLFPEDKRDSMIVKMRKKIQKTLENTRFHNCPIVPTAAKPGGGEIENSEALGTKELIEALTDVAYVPQRIARGPFVFAVDHCFFIRGQGTVLTGTVVSGQISIGDSIEIPFLKEVRKVKSIQMFRKPRDSAMQGDRVGICVTQFEAKHLERGLVCSPGALPTLYAAIATAEPIKYYKGTVRTKSKYHISLGHETVMAVCKYFSSGGEPDAEDRPPSFDWDTDYAYADELVSESKPPVADTKRRQFVLLEFERPVTAPLNCLVIGSKLDTDVHQNVCRLAFHGRLLHAIEEKKYAETVFPRLKIFKLKAKEGVVERMTDDYNVIVRSLLKKETNIKSFAGLKVRLSSGEEGTIEGSFGQSGKIKVYVPGGLRETTVAVLNKDKKKSKGKIELADGGSHQSGETESIRVHLTFKRYVNDASKRLIQS